MTRSAPVPISVDQAEANGEAVARGIGGDEAGRGLSRRMFSVLAIRMFGLGLAFLMNITLARLIGVDGFGL
ncbi:MAG: hypothetical protein OEU92_00585, partial [Alphaproteobacteria bacterium]|nr:hypothetical protein [Alphaproteobacteria bacterium]